MWSAASAMHATWIPDALFARSSLPAEATIALVGSQTVALVLSAARQTDGLLAVLALPAGQTDHLAGLRACKMAIDIVARPTQDVTKLAVVVWLAGNSVGVGQGGRVCLVDAVCPLVLDAQVAVHRVLDDHLFLVQVVRCCWIES